MLILPEQGHKTQLQLLPTYNVGGPTTVATQFQAPNSVSSLEDENLATSGSSSLSLSLSLSISQFVKEKEEGDGFRLRRRKQGRGMRE
jgi:hypothetical protein